MTVFNQLNLFNELDSCDILFLLEFGNLKILGYFFLLQKHVISWFSDIFQIMFDFY